MNCGDKSLVNPNATHNGTAANDGDDVGISDGISMQPLAVQGGV